jgi:hypothetical protein
MKDFFRSSLFFNFTNNTHEKFFFSILILFAFSLISVAQKKGLISINQNDLKSYMTFFASDEMAGRETCTVVNDAAAMYI